MTTYYGPYGYGELEPLARALQDVCELAEIDYTRGMYIDSSCPGVADDELEERIDLLDELIRVATLARSELQRITRGEEN